MNAPVPLPSDGDRSGRELSPKKLDLIQKVLKTGTPHAEPVETKRTSEPQFGMNPLFDPTDM